MADPRLIHQGPPLQGSRGRLLLVSWHFPPGQAAGSLRWHKLSHHAARRGWALDVVAADPSQAGLTSPATLTDLPNGIRVYGVTRPSIWQERLEDTLWRLLKSGGPAPSSASSSAAPSSPVTKTKLPESLAPDEIRWRLNPRDAFRAWTAYLDFARYGAWAREVATLGINLGSTAGYRAVISCGPPHLAHSAARVVARRLGIPLVLDLRDPFATRRRLPAPLASPLWFALARRHERLAVGEASLVVANTEPLRHALASAHPTARATFITVTNGCDDDEPPPASSFGDRFTIAYAGSLYLDRDPRPVFRAIASAVRLLRLTPEVFGAEFIGGAGSYDGIPLATMAAQEGVGEFITFTDRLPRAEALARLTRAAMLLSLPQDSQFAIPSKIFEYLRFDAWLLVMADPGSPTAELLRGSGADVVPTKDDDALVGAITRRVHAFQQGERPTRLARDPRFTRGYQADRLFDAIEASGTPTGGVR